MYSCRISYCSYFYIPFKEGTPMYEIKIRKLKTTKDELIFCGYDGWNRATWKYKNIYLKSITLTANENSIPNLLYDTADGEFDGEPNNPYKIILI